MLADTYTYTYTGNNFTSVSTPYSTSDSVSGWFTLSAPILSSIYAQQVTPISFSFTDRVQTITNLNAAESSAFFLVTYNAGAFPYWDIVVYSSDFVGAISTDGSLSSGDGGASGRAYGEDFSSPGTWTITDNAAPSATPEPSGILLLGTGLLGTASVVRRRTICTRVPDK
jgi:hypothetical protein